MNPNTPNADQLEFIHPKNSPTTNPASYEGQPLPEGELKTQGPTIVLHPNAVYLVDPEAAGERRDKLEGAAGGEVKPPEPVEPLPPELLSLEPAELPVWAQDTPVQFVGRNFTMTSVIVWNGGDEPTSFIDAEHLSTIVKPSTVQVPAPYVVQAWVKEGGTETAKLDFTFIA
jgi:hypothetical protein